MAQNVPKRWKSVKVPNETYKKIRRLSRALARKEFSGANIGLADAVGYAVTKTLNDIKSKPFKLRFGV